jgi:hypothetical protein
VEVMSNFISIALAGESPPQLLKTVALLPALQPTIPP